MAGRIRSIKPEILDDEEVSSLSDEAWRLWVSLWLLADDAGNSRAGDRYLASLVWQDSSRSPRIAEVLRELRKARRIEVYENGGERFANIRNWAKHQRIDNAGKPRVHGPDHEDSTPWNESRGESPRVSAVRRLTSDLRPPINDPDHRPPTTLPDSSPSAPLELIPSAPLFDLDALYALYPRKEGKAKGMAKLKRVITTPAQYERFAAAVRNYSKHVAGRPADKVKHFDSFVSCWEDYADGLPFVASAVPSGDRQYKNFQGPRSAVAESKDVKL